MRFCIILGTRPEIIKMCPIIRELEKRELDYFVIHTNQHYSENLDKIFFEDLRLKPTKYNLNVGSGLQGEQTGRMLERLEPVLIKEKPDVVLVEGDTNTVLAGALVATKLGIKIGHVEAGLRSYDKTMPEEINRVLVDHVSDYLFCPTEIEKTICLKEGIDNEKVFVTGNTIVDSVYQNIELINEDTVFAKYGVTKKEYIFVTMHRPSNVDFKEVLKTQLDNISYLAKQKNLKVIFPIHPRTRKNIFEFNIELPQNIILYDPIDYLETLALMKNAKVILTDSGGIQEEACILQIPCLTLRENTERPQTLEVGSNILVGSDRQKLLNSFDLIIQRKNWKNPFGDGKASEKIINILTGLKK